MNRPRLTLSLFAVLAQLGLAVVARADDAVWQLAPEAQVDSSGIFLSQLVNTSPSSVVLPLLRLAPAPHLGQTALLSRDQIAALMRQLNSSLAITNWSGATQIRVTRRARQLPDYDLAALLTTTLQREYVKDHGELELHLTRPWTAVQVPDETLSLKVFDLPSAGINPDSVCHCELWSGPERVGVWEVAFHAAIWRDIPVAHSALMRGESLKDADVTMERRDMLTVRDAYLNFSHADENLEMAENLPVGAPVLNRSVRPRPVIQRGQTVEGVYMDGSLSISLKVETLEDGLLGQTVRVRNPKTKRELHGKVQNEQTVLIAL